MKIKPRFTTDYKDLSVLIKTIRIGMLDGKFKGVNEGGQSTSILYRGKWQIRIYQNVKVIHLIYNEKITYNKLNELEDCHFNYEDINKSIQKIYDSLVYTGD